MWKRKRKRENGKLYDQEERERGEGWCVMCEWELFGVK